MILADGSVVPYGPGSPDAHTAVRLTSVVQLPRSIVWPGEYITCRVADVFPADSLIALEPFVGPDAVAVWPPPDVVQAVGHSIALENNTNAPVVVDRLAHICRLSSTYCPPTTPIALPSAPARPSHSHTPVSWFSDAIQVDPDGQLSTAYCLRFRALLRDIVFDPDYPGYNGARGRFCAVINMGKTLSPQHKGRLPLYGRD